MRKITSLLILSIVFVLAACNNKQPAYQQKIVLTGEWILEQDGSSKLNPQSSGLSFSDKRLFALSDASAHHSQIKRIHELDPVSGDVINKYGPFELSVKLTNSCFAAYLADRPDYEALVSLNQTNDEELATREWLLVTEDATRGAGLSDECKRKFGGSINTGSTEYPTLLVRVTQYDDSILVTGVRALKFTEVENAGVLPNDGIEGMSLTKDGRLLLGLERDTNGKPRVFEMPYQASIFDVVDEFIAVQDANLLMPSYQQVKTLSGSYSENEDAKSPYPINGMDVFYPAATNNGFLIAAARNDNQLWIIDLEKKLPTKIISISFEAPSLDMASCPKTHTMNNTSIEGVAIEDNVVYLVNDPWKVNYMNNLRCEADRQYYERMSPLLFKYTMPEAWFK